MESGTVQAFLRVLYTVNNNPQYILAKSSSQVPAIICGQIKAQSSTNEHAYARAPLKACLTAVCDSSPELLQDHTRDFSLYVLDPLEAQLLPTSLGHRSKNTASPRGVAVALGLMSWALDSIDSTNVFVTGTIIQNASPALEVIFALRETRRIPKPMLRSYSSLGPISAPGPAPDPTHPPQVAGTGWPSTSHIQHGQQERRTLTRSADFPELYIGPPRRAPGRPEGSTSSKSKVKSQSGGSSLLGASSLQVAETRSKKKTKPRPPRPPPTHSPFICEPLSRNTAPGYSEAAGIPNSHSQPHLFSLKHAQLHLENNNSLLGLLSAIPSTSSGNPAVNTAPEQQAVLLSAVQGLLVANPHLLQLAMTNMGLSTTASTEEQIAENKPVPGENNAATEHDDADSDIIILDSSTIDTAAFRKPRRKEPVAGADTDASSLATYQDSPLPSSQGTASSPLPASTPPSGLEGTPGSSTPAVTPETKTPTSRRVSPERTGSGDVGSSQAFDAPATPTPSRTRKRKLDEYVEGQVRSSPPTTPPSPSPSVARTSTKTLIAKQRVFSSPTRRIHLMSPSVRLPSMLGAMRSMITNRHGDQSTTVVLGPSKSTADHPTAASPSTTSNMTSLKRRFNLNLNEVMEEQEARKCAKVRKQSSSERKPEVEFFANGSQATVSRSSKFVSTLRYTQSSPPRPLFRPDPVDSSLSVSSCQPALVSNTTAATPASTFLTASASLGQSASTTTAAPTKNPLKNFVVPAWARTATATLPRLSDEALARQRAEREAKKAQVVLRRREAAKAKRKRLRDADRPSKESSDEGDEVAAIGPRPWTSHLSLTLSRSAPLPPAPPSALPVFASDAVVPIPSSPTQPQLAPPTVPSTPPRKHVSQPSASHRTPHTFGLGSLFTPSGQDLGSLFTPSTPCVTRSCATFTPRSPTVLHRSGTKKSPRKSLPQTPWTPKHNRNGSFASPSLAKRTPQTRMGMGTRAFLLPPPSPTSQTPRQGDQLRFDVSGAETSLVPGEPGIVKQESSPDKWNIKTDKGKGPEEDVPTGQPDGATTRENMPTPTAQCGLSHSHSSIVDDVQETSEMPDIPSNSDVSRAGEYASSPLPPSSPLPASPFSSPTKNRDSDADTPTINDLVVPDSDILLPSASESDGPRNIPDANWLSDDACTASFLADSEASAWLTETEAWLTDTEGGGGPLLTDSDGAWLSDSDAVFGDMSSLLPSAASNWFSDDADVDTDGEAVGAAMVGGLDVVAFEKAFAALVDSERGGDEGDGSAAAGSHGTNMVDSEFWDAVRPMLEGNTLNGAGAAGDAADKPETAQDFQALLDGLVGT